MSLLLVSGSGPSRLHSGILLIGIAAVQHHRVTAVSITKLGTMLRNGINSTIAASAYFPQP
jgi:hypothetical protein